jgi:hypothetical protein
LYLIGRNANGRLREHERFFRKAMGICVPDKDTIQDRCFVPKRCGKPQPAEGDVTS